MAVFDAAGRHRHADRPPIAALAGAASHRPTGSRSPRPARWRSSPTSRRRRRGRRRRLFKMCCDSLLASFKIWNAATVGGNICMSLPAGSMISLTASLEGTYTLWPRERGAAHRSQPSTSSPAITRMSCGRASCCAPSISRRRALAKRFAFRRASLTHLGRSAIIVIGTQAPGADDLLLTVTAATVKAVPAALRSRARRRDAA